MVLHLLSDSREISFRLDDCPTRKSRAATPHRSNYSIQGMSMGVKYFCKILQVTFIQPIP
jgi:hypothetical protein